MLRDGMSWFMKSLLTYMVGIAMITGALAISVFLLAHCNFFTW